MRVYSFVALVALATAGPANAQHYVSGHVTKSGTYVAPHMQTNPNSTVHDNYSTRPNVNPYTGKVGTVNPYAPSSLYSAPRTTAPACYYNCPR